MNNGASIERYQYASNISQDDRLVHVGSELARVRKIVGELEWATWGDPKHHLANALTVAKRDLECLTLLAVEGKSYVPKF